MIIFAWLDQEAVANSRWDLTGSMAGTLHPIQLSNLSGNIWHNRHAAGIHSNLFYIDFWGNSYFRDANIFLAAYSDSEKKKL